jgi:di/tricarboxylate transporter
MWEPWFTLLVIAVTLVSLIRNLARPEYIFLSALLVLVIAGILTPFEALNGFTNDAVIAVGSLFLVAAGVHQTRALAFLEKILLPNKMGISAIMLRLMGSTAFMSAFLNNTPVVAMLIPQIQNWAKRTNRNASKYLIPLSYAAIIGGTVTLIGTSTNLIVSGLLVQKGYTPLGFFELTWIGLPAAFLVIIYFITIGHKTLPELSPALTETSQNNVLNDQKLELTQEKAEIGLKINAPFLPRLAWVDFQEQNEDIFTDQPNQGFHENQISEKNSSRSKSLNQNDDIIPDIHSEAPWSDKIKPLFVLAVLITMISLAAFGIMPIALAAFIAAIVIIITGCLKPRKIIPSLNLPILLVIAGAIGVGQAMDASGLAQTGGTLILDVTSSFGFIAVIISIYLTTNILTEMITNNAAAVLMFPIAIIAAYEMGMDPHAAAVTVAMAASASFLTPYGYQTNLMVMDAGGYTFNHYVKAGIPVTLIVMSVTVFMVYFLWF